MTKFTVEVLFGGEVMATAGFETRAAADAYLSYLATTTPHVQTRLITH